MGVVNNRQVPQAQKIHLQQAQLLNGGHGVLGDYRVVIFGQRDILHHRPVGNHHPRRVSGGVAGHALHLPGHVKQILHLGVGFHPLPQLLGLLERRVQGHAQGQGYQLGNLVHLVVGNVQRPAHIPQSPPRRHGAEGDDLGHMVRAVLVHHIVDHLVPALVAEIDVKVGHAHPFRVQKALEQQMIAHGIHIGNAHAVGRQACRPRTPPRAPREYPRFWRNG